MHSLVSFEQGGNERLKQQFLNCQVPTKGLHGRSDASVFMRSLLWLQTIFHANISELPLLEQVEAFHASQPLCVPRVCHSLLKPFPSRMTSLTAGQGTRMLVQNSMTAAREKTTSGGNKSRL